VDMKLIINQFLKNIYYVKIKKITIFVNSVPKNYHVIKVNGDMTKICKKIKESKEEKLLIENIIINKRDILDGAVIDQNKDLKYID
tara:strand:+ start:206 stop:463 length:258 start_codon:yes stop_codon:yes gene_type:complete